MPTPAKILWSFQTPSGIIGQPVTWERNGKQYVTVLSGIGGVYALRAGDPALRTCRPACRYGRSRCLTSNGAVRNTACSDAWCRPTLAGGRLARLRRSVCRRERAESKVMQLFAIRFDC